MKVVIREWNCPECHTVTSNKEVKFCSKCGHKLLPTKEYYFNERGKI